MQALVSPFVRLDVLSHHRALASCLAASILLHAGLLFLLPGMREGGKSSTPAQILSATFAPRSAATPPAKVEEVKPEPPRVEAPKPLPRPQPKPLPTVEAPRPVLSAPTPSSTPAPPVAAPTPSPAVPQPPPVATAPVAPPTASAPQTAASVPRPSQAPVASAPATAPSDAADAGSLDQYRLALITSARRYKRYPAQAMEKGWQGKVEVRLQIGADGRIKHASVKTTSGYSILDQQAVDMITKGKTLTQIPTALRGKEFIVDVPVIFDLQTG